MLPHLHVFYRRRRRPVWPNSAHHWRSYAVLVAEQLLALGAKIIQGLTSAGRVNPDLSIPGIVVATVAIRDEGTSHQYLPAGNLVSGDHVVVHLPCEWGITAHAHSQVAPIVVHLSRHFGRALRNCLGRAMFELVSH